MRGRRGSLSLTITTIDDEDNKKMTTRLASEKQLTTLRQRFFAKFVHVRCGDQEEFFKLDGRESHTNFSHPGGSGKIITYE